MLSVDIDSYDLEVWNAVVKYRPKIVIIESNPAYPPGVISTHNPPDSLYRKFQRADGSWKAQGIPTGVPYRELFLRAE